MLLLEPMPFVRGLVRKKVDVVNYPDGRFAVEFEGVSLPFRVFDKIQTVQPGEIIENKRLAAALALVSASRNKVLPGSRCSSAQTLSQHGRELGFPVANCLMAEQGERAGGQSSRR